MNRYILLASAIVFSVLFCCSRALWYNAVLHKNNSNWIVFIATITYVDIWWQISDIYEFGKFWQSDLLFVWFFPFSLKKISMVRQDHPFFFLSFFQKVSLMTF